MTTLKWQGSCKKNASQANGRRPHKLIYHEEEEKILQIWALRLLLGILVRAH